MCKRHRAHPSGYASAPAHVLLFLVRERRTKQAETDRLDEAEAPRDSCEGVGKEEKPFPWRPIFPFPGRFVGLQIPISVPSEPPSQSSPGILGSPFG